MRELHLFLRAKGCCYFFKAPKFILVRKILVKLSAQIRIAFALLLYLFLHLYQALNVVFVEEKGAILLPASLLPDFLFAKANLSHL